MCGGMGRVARARERRWSEGGEEDVGKRVRVERVGWGGWERWGQKLGPERWESWGQELGKDNQDQRVGTREELRELGPEVGTRELGELGPGVGIRELGEGG